MVAAVGDALPIPGKNLRAVALAGAASNIVANREFWRSLRKRCFFLHTGASISTVKIMGDLYYEAQL